MTRGMYVVQLLRSSFAQYESFAVGGGVDRGLPSLELSRIVLNAIELETE